MVRYVSDQCPVLPVEVFVLVQLVFIIMLSIRVAVFLWVGQFGVFASVALMKSLIWQLESCLRRLMLYSLKGCKRGT